MGVGFCNGGNQRPIRHWEVMWHAGKGMKTVSNNVGKHKAKRKWEIERIEYLWEREYKPGEWISWYAINRISNLTDHPSQFTEPLNYSSWHRETSKIPFYMVGDDGRKKKNDLTRISWKVPPAFKHSLLMGGFLDLSDLLKPSRVERRASAPHTFSFTLSEKIQLIANLAWEGGAEFSPALLNVQMVLVRTCECMQEKNPTFFFKFFFGKPYAILLLGH